MIGLILGRPGGGKSYEAVVHHILPAVASGRKVITNVPVNEKWFHRIVPESVRLLELREDVRADGSFSFSDVGDYGDPWRHPTTGVGPLYVIDEVHKCLPAVRSWDTGYRAVEQWFALHRHEGADVLLLTQSVRQCNKGVMELVQTVYKVSKNVALGSSKSYTFKVQDGLRGAVVNTRVRRYEKRFFEAYRSYTKGGGGEAVAADITPVWLNWRFLAAGIALAIGVWVFASGEVQAPLSMGQDSLSRSRGLSEGESVRVWNAPGGPGSQLRPAAPGAGDAGSASVAAADIGVGHPYAGYQFRFEGGYIRQGVTVAFLSVVRNGSAITQVTSEQLRALGYDVAMLGDAAARVSFKSWSTFAIRDRGRQQVEIPLGGTVGDPGPSQSETGSPVSTGTETASGAAL
jgi:zona occludens toxin